MKITLLVVSFLMLAGCTKKVENICTPVQSINDLEVCQLPGATVILSKGGQTVFPRDTAKAATDVPKPSPTPEKGK